MNREVRWLACDMCGWEFHPPWTFATVAGTCPMCLIGSLHFHNDSDGERPKTLKPETTLHEPS